MNPRPGLEPARAGHAAAPHGADPVARAADPPAPRRLASADLFAGTREVQIEHGQQIYRLRRTALGKLILTK